MSEPDRTAVSPAPVSTSSSPKRGDHLGEHREGIRRVHVRSRDGPVARWAQVDPDADGDPVGNHSSPPRLHEHPSQLPCPDKEVVGPLQAYRGIGPAFEHWGQSQADAQRQHPERRRIARALDEGEPEPSAGRGLPRLARPTTAGPLRGGEHERPGRGAGRGQRVRLVHRTPHCLVRVHAREVEMSHEVVTRPAEPAHQPPRAPRSQRMYAPSATR